MTDDTTQLGITNSTRTSDELIDRIIEWSNSEAGAHAVWQAWFDGMTHQNRFVNADRQYWPGLATRDKKLDSFIAATVIAAAILHAKGQGSGN